MCAATIALAAITGLHRPLGAQVNGAADSDSSRIYSGVYTGSFRESIFSPCDVPGIGSGWAPRYRNARHGAFLDYQHPVPGKPTLSHFVRLRGRLSGPGRYGFQNREILVDSVLEISETPLPCRSYEDLPHPWPAVPSSGAPIIGVVTTDDRTLIAVLDLESIASIWNTRLDTLMQRFVVPEKGQLSWASRIPMAFTPDGKRLAIGGIDGVVRVFNPLTGEPAWTFSAEDTIQGTVNGKRVVAPSGGVTFNETGTLLAATAGENTRIWSMETGKRVGTHHGRWGSKFLFIGDSSFIASADSGLMKIYPRLGAAPIWRIRSAVKRFDVMERSADRRWLAVKSWEDSVSLWSLADGLPGPTIAIPYWFGNGAIAFSPDGNTIAISGGGNGLYLWETRTGLPVRSFQKFPMGVQRAWFSRDGRSIIAYAMSDTVLRIVHLDGASGNVLKPVEAWWGPSRLWREPAQGPFGSVSGFVRDHLGKPIAGAAVSILDGDNRHSTEGARTSTNAAGHFLLQRIKFRHATVHAEKKGFAPQIRHAHLPAPGISVDFNLEPQP